MRRLQQLFLMACLALLPAQGWGAAVHDGEAEQTGSVSAGTSLSITNKTTAGSDRVGLVHCAWNNNTPTISGITWNGVAMTQVVTDTETAGAGLAVALWRIVAPPTAASTISVTFGSNATAYCVASSYNGADQSTPISNSNSVHTSGAAVSPTTLTCTTAADETVVDAVSWSQFDSVAPAVGANQTSLLNQFYASFYFALASRQLGSVDGVMSWTFSGNSNWTQVCASIKAASAGAATVRTLMMLGVGQ